MASSFYSNTQLIDFDSILAMDDPGMVSMFQALKSSGLEGFLGCSAVIYEAALVDFFENTSVRDGVLISTVAGQLVEIFEEWFEESFDLPVDGLSELSEIPKDVVFDARSIVSLSGEPVSLSGKKSQMNVEYRLLCDIMAKSISVKAGSFNAITVEKFLMVTAVVCGVRMIWARVLFNTLKKMVTPGSKQAKGFAVQISLLLENIPNLELGESSEFPASKTLTEKLVHRYVSLNDKGGAKEAADAPLVKKAPKKRPAAADFEAPVIKKKRTMKKKSCSSKAYLAMVAVAQEAAPIQMVEPTTTEPATEDEISADPSADEVSGETADVEVADEGSNEEPAAGDATRINEPTSEPAVADIVIEEPSTSDDVDVIIEQVLADTARFRVDEEEQVVRTLREGNQPAGTAKEPQWFDLPYDDLISRWDAERPVVTASDTDEEEETMDVGAAGGDQQLLEHKDDVNKIRETLSLHINNLERMISDRFDAHDRTYRVLFNNVRHDMRDHKNLLSLDLKSYQQKVSIQVGAAALDTFDLRSEVKAMNAKVDILSSRLDDVNKNVEDTKEAISHQLLEFQSQAQANHIFLTDQLGQLVDYINRGGNAKKGEGESSRGPQPPLVVQIRDSGIAGGSGNAVRTTELTQADIDAANRQILERMMREDRERERERRSKSRSGSFKRKRY
ncbi:hypothetical protein F511_20315 [Dorcoceras hygrometricum]|uniref:Dystroglycan-like n=1 Tax=Dorcoceras hygrometricum TaxID=472368 RepID=A0A2Z7CD96_9LAMI|nr:hypothetical protein F511_20315 [Dorcoceras hygrometricum]